MRVCVSFFIWSKELSWNNLLICIIIINIEGMHSVFIPGVLVLDSFRRIRSFNMSEHGEWAVFRVMSGELRRSCFCFNRDRSFKFGSDTKKVQIIKNRTL